MRHNFIAFSGCILLVLSFACSNGGSGQAKMVRSMPEPGVVHEMLVCAGDPGKSYALYIPHGEFPSSFAQTETGSSPASLKSGKGVHPKHLFPVIIAFDPHGKGSLPLKLYKSLAEKYGFIMIGSNDSKNGLPADQVRGIVASLVEEARTVYPVDTGRIYLLGFSGGARVAAMAALYQLPVAGVIGCGAGFGGTEQPVLYKFDYYGIVGTADFNMNEMLQLDGTLSRSGFRHFITTYPGIHAWPNVDVMEDGFRWVTLNAMKDGTVAKDKIFISKVSTTFENRVNLLKGNKEFIATADACKAAISFLQGLTSTEIFTADFNTVTKLPEYKFQLTYRQSILEKEEAEKQELIQALQSKDLKWWKMKITNYQLQITNYKGKSGFSVQEDTLKDRRLLAFLSLFCYMNANAALTQQNESAAVNIIAIYEMADKSNPEPNYLRAILLARKSNNDAAFAQLNLAVDKGFTDQDRLSGQPEFQPLNSSPKWLDLLRRIK